MFIMTVKWGYFDCKNIYILFKYQNVSASSYVTILRPSSRRRVIEEPPLTKRTQFKLFHIDIQYCQRRPTCIALCAAIRANFSYTIHFIIIETIEYVPGNKFGNKFWYAS